MGTSNLVYSLSSQFTVDLSDQCLVGAVLSIQPSSTGTSADYTTTDGLRTVQVTSTLSDPTLEISIPEPMEAFRDLAFRVSLSLTYGIIRRTNNIFVRVYDCSLAVTIPTNLPTTVLWWPSKVFVIPQQFGPTYCTPDSISI